MQAKSLVSFSSTWEKDLVLCTIDSMSYSGHYYHNEHVGMNIPFAKLYTSVYICGCVMAIQQLVPNKIDRQF